MGKSEAQFLSVGRALLCKMGLLFTGFCFALTLLMMFGLAIALFAGMSTLAVLSFVSLFLLSAAGLAHAYQLQAVVITLGMMGIMIGFTALGLGIGRLLAGTVKGE